MVRQVEIGGHMFNETATARELAAVSFEELHSMLRIAHSRRLEINRELGSAYGTLELFEAALLKLDREEKALGRLRIEEFRTESVKPLTEELSRLLALSGRIYCVLQKRPVSARRET